jgi:hypothetical protein
MGVSPMGCESVVRGERAARSPGPGGPTRSAAPPPSPRLVRYRSGCRPWPFRRGLTRGMVRQRLLRGDPAARPNRRRSPAVAGLNRRGPSARTRRLSAAICSSRSARRVSFSAMDRSSNSIRESFSAVWALRASTPSPWSHWRRATA